MMSWRLHFLPWTTLFTHWKVGPEERKLPWCKWNMVQVCRQCKPFGRLSHLGVSWKHVGHFLEREWQGQPGNITFSTCLKVKCYPLLSYVLFVSLLGSWQQQDGSVPMVFYPGCTSRDGSHKMFPCPCKPLSLDMHPPIDRKGPCTTAHTANSNSGSWIRIQCGDVQFPLMTLKQGHPTAKIPDRKKKPFLHN